jgi:UDP:flavonoid glycosyltransferase YjiC (YdhE family)
MQQSHEMTDAAAAAAEDHPSHNYSLAAAPMAAGLKAKLSLQQQPAEQLDVCDTAAAVAGMADNMQQHTQLPAAVQCLPVVGSAAEAAAAAAVAVAGSSREGSKRSASGWLW